MNVPGSGDNRPVGPARAGDRRPALGRRAEEAAASLLEGKGYRILDRNWRLPTGELDLVADDHGTCVFIEVRSRTGSEFGHPLEAVSAQKRARVVRAARHYLAEVAPRADGFRFDVVGVLFATAEAEPECFHVANAFEADGTTV